MMYKLCVGHVQGHQKTFHFGIQLRPEIYHKYQKWLKRHSFNLKYKRQNGRLGMADMRRIYGGYTADIRQICGGYMADIRPMVGSYAADIQRTCDGHAADNDPCETSLRSSLKAACRGFTARD